MSDNGILMPKSLTAENGAKALLSGEFTEDLSVTCIECDGDGHTGDNECIECKGSGDITLTIPVSWDNIKAIYAKAVEFIGVNL